MLEQEEEERKNKNSKIEDKNKAHNSVSPQDGSLLASVVNMLDPVEPVMDEIEFISNGPTPDVEAQEFAAVPVDAGPEELFA